MSKKKTYYGDYCEIRDGSFYGRVSIPVGNGRYKLKRRKVSSRIEARQWAQQELDKASASADIHLETFGELAAWYIKHYLTEPVIEDGRKVSGVKDYKRLTAKLKRMSEILHNKKLKTFNDHHLHVYAKDRREKDGVTTTTLNRDFALMRAAFRRAQEVDKGVPVLKFPINTSAEVERDRVLSTTEEAALLGACVEVESMEYKRKGKAIKTSVHRAKRSHLRPVVIIAVDTALRTKELLSLLWSDIDLTEKIINVRSNNTKTQKSRKVGITSRVQKELAKMPVTKGKVFTQTTVRRAFNTACKRAGIKDLRFHDLRHTATTRMIRAGVPHTEVMKITGHTQMKTFLRYLNLMDDTVQNAAEQLDRFNGEV